MDWSLGGPQSRSGRGCIGKKILSLLLPGIEILSSSPLLVCIQTELSWTYLSITFTIITENRLQYPTSTDTGNCNVSYQFGTSMYGISDAGHLLLEVFGLNHRRNVRKRNGKVLCKIVIEYGIPME
jgi:hypothetical protein